MENEYWPPRELHRDICAGMRSLEEYIKRDFRKDDKSINLNDLKRKKLKLIKGGKYGGRG
jgi:hypothetical protein